MNACAKPFSLSKLSKFPQNKKAGFPPEKSSERPSPGAVCGERPHRGGRKKIKKNPPKNGSSPLAFDGALRESPLRKKQHEQANHLFATMDEKCLVIYYGSFISDGPKRQTFLNLPPRPKIKRLEVARKRRASFKPT